jgi:hypothetical protein
MCFAVLALAAGCPENGSGSQDINDGSAGSNGGDHTVAGADGAAGTGGRAGTSTGGSGGSSIPASIVDADPAVKAASAPTDFVATALWGAAPDDLWIGGNKGLIQHWDGKAWTDRPFPTTCVIQGLWGAGPGAVYAVSCNIAAIWTGSAWNELQTPLTGTLLSAVSGSSSSDVWLGAEDGKLAHWDGRGWSSFDSATDKVIRSFWINNANDGWLVSGSGSRTTKVSRWSGREWTAIDMTGVGTGIPLGVFAIQPSDIWIGTHDGVYRFDGARWREPPGPADMPGRGSLFGLWGRSSSDLYAAGSPLWHFDGETWTAIAIPAPNRTVRAIWGQTKPGGEIWIAGDLGFIGRAR